MTKNARRNLLGMLIVLLFWSAWYWTLIAWGETLPVTKEMLMAGNHAAVLPLPCNWDKNLDSISSTAVYANPGEYTDVAGYSILDRDSVVNEPILPVSITVNGDKLHVTFAPIEMMQDGKYLYHVNVEVGTTGATCQQGFGFGFGTRPRR